jgi:hypothetical protein
MKSYNGHFLIIPHIVVSKELLRLLDPINWINPIKFEKVQL